MDIQLAIEPLGSITVPSRLRRTPSKEKSTQAGQLEADDIPNKTDHGYSESYTASRTSTASGGTRAEPPSPSFRRGQFDIQPSSPSPTGFDRNYNFTPSGITTSQTRIKTNGSLGKNSATSGQGPYPRADSSTGLESDSTLSSRSSHGGDKASKNGLKDSKDDESQDQPSGQQGIMSMETPSVSAGSFPQSFQQQIDDIPLIDSCARLEIDQENRDCHDVDEQQMKVMLKTTTKTEDHRLLRLSSSSLNNDLLLTTTSRLRNADDPATTISPLPVRRQMSMRLPVRGPGDSGMTASSVANRRYTQSLQVIGELKRQLQELDVHQSEVMVELDLERALLEGECSLLTSRLLALERNPPKNPHGSPSMQSQDLNVLRKRLRVLQQQMLDSSNKLNVLRTQFVSQSDRNGSQNDPVGHQNLEDRIKMLENDLENKRRLFENLEYCILEAEMTETDDEKEVADRRHSGEMESENDEMEETRQELQQLDGQLRVLLEQTQLQTNSLSSRRHTLLDRLKAEYRTLQRISDVQSLAHNFSHTQGSSEPRSAPHIAKFPPINILEKKNQALSPNEKSDLTLPSISANQLMSPVESQNLPSVENPAGIYKPQRLIISRPLTRYMPQTSGNLNLEEYLESCGHDLQYCRQFIILNESSCCGYLRKLSTLGPSISLWRRRWFVFDRTSRSFSYAKSQREMQSSNARNVHVVAFDEIEDVYVEHKDTAKKQSGSSRANRVFCVSSWQRRYILQAPSAALMRLWVEAVGTGAQGNVVREYWQD